MARLLSASVHDLALAHAPVSADDVLDGAPSTGDAALATVGDVAVGVWEMTAGTARDTEVDEVFVVLTGRGTVRFADGEEVPLAPGTAVRLTAGEATTWQVTEPLRKVYVALG